MILEHDHWHLGYQQILKDCRPGGGGGGARTVLLLCNADVDAMASARILSYMLRCDGVHYQLLPCTCYGDLERRLSAMGGGQQQKQLGSVVGAVVLLNFGASRNLTRLFDDGGALFLDGGDDETAAAGGDGQNRNNGVKVYVMDCRRPVHLANIYAADNVVVFWDATQGGDLPSDGDNLSGRESSSSSSSGEDDDDDDSDEDEDKENDLDDEGEEEADFGDVEGSGGEKENVEATAGSQGGVEYEGGDEQGDPLNDDSDDENDNGDGDDDKALSERNSHRMAPPRASKRQKVDVGRGGGELLPVGGTDVEHGGREDSPEEEDGDVPGQQDATSARDDGISPRERHSLRRDRLRTYYTTGSFYGSPAAFVAFRLASQLRYGEQGDLLWLACVGVTDAYLHARLDLTGYAKLAEELRHLCARLFPDDTYERALNTVYAEDLLGSSRGGGGGGQPKTKITLSDNGRIVAQKDYRFFLLRHSTLLDSMLHSDYVSTKLQVWNKRGEHKLMELLAKMGYPLDECRQPYAFMKPSLRRRLLEKFSDHAQEYNLEHFQFTSFFRVTGYQSLLSASDTSYAVTALLEYEAPTEATADDPAPPDDEEKSSVEAFNNAYDALGTHMEPAGGPMRGMGAEGSDASTLVNGGNLSATLGLGAGIRHAMTVQKSIIQTAVGLVERNAIPLLRHFRYAYVTSSSVGGENQMSRTDLIRSGGNRNGSNGNDTRDHILSKPLALTRLAHYLMDMNRENGRWTGPKARPLVLIADRPRTGTCLVVGYEYPERAGNFVKNRFGKHFEMTAESMNGTFKFDSFDSNVVEVSGADVNRFLEQLHYLLDSM